MTHPAESIGKGDGSRHRRARMLRYGVWQARDFLFERALGLLAIGGVFGYLNASERMAALHRSIATLPPALIAKWGGLAAATVMMRRDFNERFLTDLVPILVYLGAVLAMSGIVSNDRTRGYYRFLFAKPLAPWRYYGQAFVVHTLVFVAVIALLGAVFGALLWPILSLQLLLVPTLLFIMYGGATFLFSAAARWDWLALAALTLVAKVAWTKYPDSTSIYAKLLYLLPPLHRTDEVYSALAKSAPLPWPLIEWFAAYGVVCFIAGLVVLRYRRLAIL